MNKHVLFIQGAGDEGYEADKKLATSLQTVLGTTYQVHYPHLLSDESLPDFGWMKQIGHELTASHEEVILVAHSLGASMLLKYLSEYQTKAKIRGIFLMATPFWSGDEEWKEGLKLKNDFAESLPKTIPLFLYHCRDDEVVPFKDLLQYKQQLPHAVIREPESGGHQFNNDLSVVAKDIKEAHSIKLTN